MRAAALALRGRLLRRDRLAGRAADLFSLLVPGSELLLDIRILRLLRVFRIFKLTLYIEEYTRLGEALSASRRKIMVFLSVVLMAILILGTVMYVVEGPQNGYTSIPVAMYWATVTMTTVGYGDITPHTHLGKAIASFMMLMGWGILAVPTGIVTRNRHAVVGVDVAVHVGQGKLGFVNRGFECHKVCFFISGLGGNEPSIGTERRPVTPAERDLAGLAIVARP
jgi:hypothetical protein